MTAVSFRLAVLLIACCLNALVLADEVLLFDGDAIVGRVVRYEKSTVTVIDDQGQGLKVPVLNIERINFDRPAGEDSPDAEPKTPRYELELAERIEDAKESLASRAEAFGGRRQSAIVAMYLETAEIGDTPPKGHVEYRCYNSSGGYSGVWLAPLRQAWTRFENLYVGQDGACRIQLDPGPPYKIVNRSVFLKPGGVANLGRVVLEKVQAEGTASVGGFVTDGFGQPVEDALVRAGGRAARTDADGAYLIDGFGLEQFTVSASKPGFSGRGARMEIRDMSRRLIEQSIQIYRPRRVRLRYVISGPNSDSFEGEAVQSGTIERTIVGAPSRLAGTLFASQNFSKFAEDVRMELELEGSRITIDNRNAPIYYQPVDRSVDFDAITEVGDLEVNSQQCPLLAEGDMVVIRGFRQGRSGVSEYCVKVFVEEIALTDEGVALPRRRS